MTNKITTILLEHVVITRVHSHWWIWNHNNFSTGLKVVHSYVIMKFDMYISYLYNAIFIKTYKKVKFELLPPIIAQACDLTFNRIFKWRKWTHSLYFIFCNKKLLNKIEATERKKNENTENHKHRRRWNIESHPHFVIFRNSNRPIGSKGRNSLYCMLWNFYTGIWFPEDANFLNTVMMGK